MSNWLTCFLLTVNDFTLYMVHEAINMYAKFKTYRAYKTIFYCLYLSSHSVLAKCNYILTIYTDIDRFTPISIETISIPLKKLISSKRLYLFELHQLKIPSKF